MADEYRIISNPSNEPSNNGSADMSALTQQLKDLNATNGKMLEVLSKMSQTNVRGNTPFNDKYRSARSGGSWGRNNSNFNIDLRNIQAQSKHAMERIMGDFFDGLENQVVNTITSSVRSRGKQVANDFAKELGIEKRKNGG